MSQTIEEKINTIVTNRNIYRTGRVTKVNDFVIETVGLDDVFFFEKIYIGNEDNIGYIDKIESNKVYVSIVQEKNPIRIGDEVISTGQPLTTYFSEESMGMVIDMFGKDKLTGKPFNHSKSIMIETPKIGIMERTSVCRPLETGIAAIDMLYPIGRGQRQLIIGDKKIGKTQIALDTIVNQKDKNMICIYIAIGKTKKDLKTVYAKLIEKGANAYTTIVAAFNDDAVPVLKLTPYVGMSIAEEYLHQGKDVLVIIDDLKKHADACREIALIANKNTGRDAYPADIFYTHSRLLEKGCQHKNGGSITVLPIIETKGNDITDYISTNVISITDGQIVLSPKLFEKGQKPAIDYGLSVSRLGSAVQNQSIVEVGATIRKTLLSYLETAEVYELVNEETMTIEVKHKLKVGKKILAMLKQPKFTSLSATELAQRFEFIYMDKEEDEKNDNEEIVINTTVAENVEPASDAPSVNANVEIIPVQAEINNAQNNNNDLAGPQVLEQLKEEVTSPVTLQVSENQNTESSPVVNIETPKANNEPAENKPAPVQEEPKQVEQNFVKPENLEMPVKEVSVQQPQVEQKTIEPEKLPVSVKEEAISPVVEEPEIELPKLQTNSTSESTSNEELIDLPKLSTTSSSGVNQNGS